MAKNLRGASIVVLALSSLQVGIVALGSIRSANVLGPLEFGVFWFAYTAGNLVPFGTGLGSEHVLLMKASRDESLLPVMVGNAIVLRALVSLIALAVTGGIGYVLGWSGLPVLMEATGGALLAGFCSAPYTAAFRVLGCFQRPLIYSIIANITFVCFLYSPWARGAQASTVATMYLTSQGAAMIMASVDLLHRIPLRVGLTEYKRDARLGLLFAASQLVDFAFQRMDVFLLQMLATSVAVGTYAAGYRIAAVFLALPTAVHTVVLPEFHRLGAEAVKLNELFQRLRRVVIELCMLLMGVVLVISPWLADVLYSDRYEGLDRVMRISCIGVALVFIAYPYSMFLEAKGYVSQRLKLRVLAFTAATIACIFGIFLWRVDGAAMGVTMGSAVFLYVLHRTARRRLNCSPVGWDDVAPILLAIGAGGLVLACGALLPSGVVGLAIAGLSYTVLYLLGGHCLGIFRYLTPGEFRRVLQAGIP
jgi:O-antigen/teichoic acid export membrane protein